MGVEFKLEREVVEVLRLLGELEGKQGEVWSEVERLLQKELARLLWH